MSMRMCSLASSVHGEHNRNTRLKSTHCSSSQEFDEVSNILRTEALRAETTTAARINQAMRLPIQVVKASMARVTGSNALSHASMAPACISPPAARRRQSPARAFIIALCPTCLAPTKPPHLIRSRHEASMEKLVAGGGPKPGLGQALAGCLAGQGPETHG